MGQKICNKFFGSFRSKDEELVEGKDNFAEIASRELSEYAKSSDEYKKWNSKPFQDKDFIDEIIKNYIEDFIEWIQETTHNKSEDKKNVLNNILSTVKDKIIKTVIYFLKHPKLILYLSKLILFVKTSICRSLSIKFGQSFLISNLDNKEQSPIKNLFLIGFKGAEEFSNYSKEIIKRKNTRNIQFI